MDHKEKSIYNLAIRKKIQKSTKGRKLIPIEENFIPYSQKSNIFQEQNLEQMEITQHTQPYNLVGKKEFTAYCHKNLKKTHTLKRVDSGTSNEKQPNTVRSQDTDHAYLTKEDLLDSFNKTKKEEISRKKCPTLEKIKLKYKKYRNIWEEKYQEKLDNQRVNICELVDLSRKNFQLRERATLKEKKENIPAEKWKDTLRYSVNLSHFYDRSFVEQIKKNGINLKGVSKKAKQVDWISSKTNSVFQLYQKGKRENRGTEEKEKNDSKVLKLSKNGKI